MHILLIDEDRVYGRRLSKYLNSNGCSTLLTMYGNDSLSFIEKESPCAVLIGVKSADGDGAEQCHEIRQGYDGPIMVLANGGDSKIRAQVSCFDKGADDFIFKSTPLDVVLARLVAISRRYNANMFKDQKQQAPTPSVISDLCFYPDKYRVQWMGKCLELSAKEFEVLYFFAQHYGQVLSRERIYQALYQMEYDGENRSLDLNISRIRKKMPPHINVKSVRGRGYILIATNGYMRNVVVST